MPAEEIPPPPWRCAARAVVWWQAPTTVAAMVRYARTPVGPYREVFAGTLLPHLGRPTLHVPFIAVDDPAALRPGWEFWRLPKELARFRADAAAGDADGDPPTGDPAPPHFAAGDGWTVAVATRILGPPLPMYVPCRSEQDGLTTAVTVHGLGRPALVTVTATGSAARLTGRHPGFVASGTLLLGVPSGG